MGQPLSNKKVDCRVIEAIVRPAKHRECYA